MQPSHITYQLCPQFMTKRLYTTAVTFNNTIVLCWDRAVPGISYQVRCSFFNLFNTCYRARCLVCLVLIAPSYCCNAATCATTAPRQYIRTWCTGTSFGDESLWKVTRKILWSIRNCCTMVRRSVASCFALYTLACFRLSVQTRRAAVSATPCHGAVQPLCGGATSRTLFNSIIEQLAACSDKSSAAARTILCSDVEVGVQVLEYHPAQCWKSCQFRCDTAVNNSAIFVIVFYCFFYRDWSQTKNNTFLYNQ